MLIDGIALTDSSDISNLIVDSGTSFPAGSVGEIFYRTDLSALYVSDGTTWNPVGSSIGFDDLNVKPAVRVATTANISLGGFQTIDGYTVVAADRVLVKNQATASQNGIYVVSGGSWTRATDFDGSPSTEVKAGDFVFVTGGTTQGDTGWVLTTDGTIQIGTTALTFSQFTGANAAPGGSTTHIQYNNAGAFAGSPSLAWNNAGTQLNVYGTMTLGSSNIDPAITAVAGSPGAGRTFSINGSNAFSGNGGDVYVTSGSSSQNNTGGTVYIRGAGANSLGTSVGGSVEISTGTGAPGFGGNIRLTTGTTVPVERFRINPNGSWSVGTGGAAYGTSGQVLTSNGNAAPSWQAPSGAPASGAANLIQLSNGSGGFTAGGFSITGSDTLTVAAHMTVQPTARTATGDAGYNFAARGGDALDGAGAGSGGAGGTAFLLGGEGGNSGSGSAGAGGQVRIAAGGGGSSSGFPANGGDIIINAGLAGNDSASNRGGRIIFSTAPRFSGAFQLTERVRIDELGDFYHYGALFNIGTTGGSNRISADFSSGGATRTYIRTSTTNGTTNVGILGNGTGNGQRIAVWGQSNPLASNFAQLYVDDTIVRIDSGNVGTANAPIVFSFQNIERLRITTAGSVDFANRYTENRTAITAAASTTLDCATANVFVVTMNANITTLTFSNVPASGRVYNMTLFLNQDATGSRTITWPASVKFSNGTAPTLTTTGLKTDIVTLVTHDGGTTWFGMVAGLSF